MNLFGPEASESVNITPAGAENQEIIKDYLTKAGNVLYLIYYIKIRNL